MPLCAATIRTTRTGRAIPRRKSGVDLSTEDDDLRDLLHLLKSLPENTEVVYVWLQCVSKRRL